MLSLTWDLDFDQNKAADGVTEELTARAQGGEVAEREREQRETGITERERLAAESKAAAEKVTNAQVEKKQQAEAKEA